MPIKELDVLIHPFYQELGPQRMRKWKKRVDEISRRQHHFLAIRVPSEWHFDRSAVKSEWEEFLSYAERKLGKKRMIVVQDKSAGFSGASDKSTYGKMARRIVRAGYDKRRVRFHLYGEYADACVPTVVETLLPALISKSRIRQASRVLLELSTTEGRMLTRRDVRGNLYEDIREYVRNTYRDARK
ncbi:MAG TPA: hypothetical protein VJI13_04930 [Candidatus Norongarragalinales archaeon]|nr:hypothetical protein [Candidatus Norongarragalinales archaeon]